MQKTLIYVGIIIVLIGICWPWLGKLPFGRLPGDVIIDKPNFRFYFPLTTMILLSLLASLILWFFRR